MMVELKNSLATRLQHAGAQHRVGRGLVGAIEQSVTFSTERMDDLPVYARLSNTSNHAEVCAVVAALHKAEAAHVFASGMAALHAVLTTALRPGDHILIQENCYGSTQGLCQKILSRWGIESSFAPLEAWSAHVKENTKLLLFESISNPFCLPQNFSAALAARQRSGALLVCDNTFASPINCRPLEWGVDVVIESATKYMNGHSDLVCGTVACSAAFAQELATTAMYVGSFLSASACMQLLKGLRTLSVRMRAHNENGRAFARAAQDIPGVAHVYHGALQNPSGASWISDYGGMLAIRFSENVDAEKLIRSLSLVADVPSLGGTESTACLPWWTTNRWMADEEKRRLGIDRQLIRFSIGLENVDDLIADLASAIRSALRN